MWLAYTVQLGVKGETVELPGGAKIITGRGRNIKFTCRYKSQLLFDSNNLEIHGSPRADQVNFYIIV